MAFGSIEHTTVVCLRQIPKDKIQRFAKSLKLAARIDLILELLEPYPEPECAELAEKLRQVKLLAQTRNLIAHNPLILEFYEDTEVGYAFAESIAVIYKEGLKLSLAETQNFAVAADAMASELIDASMKAFRALGVMAGA